MDLKKSYFFGVLQKHVCDNLVNLPADGGNTWKKLSITRISPKRLMDFRLDWLSWNNCPSMRWKLAAKFLEQYVSIWRYSNAGGESQSLLNNSSSLAAVILKLKCVNKWNFSAGNIEIKSLDMLRCWTAYILHVWSRIDDFFKCMLKSYEVVSNRKEYLLIGPGKLACWAKTRFSINVAVQKDIQRKQLWASRTWQGFNVFNNWV